MVKKLTFADDGNSGSDGGSRSYYDFKDTTTISSEDSRARINHDREKKCSLELRRLPVPREVYANDEDLSDFDSDDDISSERVGWLRRVFLNSNFTLRTQMLITFGSMKLFTVLCVIILSISAAVLMGDGIKDISYEIFDGLVRQIEGKTARYLAESLALKLIPDDVVMILYESARDRFVGYPDHPGYEDDELVPFWDMDSGRNIYPIVGDPLPLDWQIKPHVNQDNYEEHVQSRWSWYEGDPQLSTASAAYYMQGMCDPSVTDPAAHTYWPNCTEDNNNIKTGGVVAPSKTNQLLHRKAADLAPLLKTLYEYHQEIKSLGFYFANGGSGSTLHFPHFPLNTNNIYESIGCNWLFETPHPYDSSRPILRSKAFQKKVEYYSICRPEGDLVSSRIYNPMERDWCRDQATHPDKIRVAGPFFDAFHDHIVLLSVGKAVYDKVTNEFIACISVDLVFDSLDQILDSSRPTSNAHVSVVRFDQNGTVVASSAWDKAAASKIMTIDMIDAGVSKSVHQSLRSLVDYNSFADGSAVWNATAIRETYESFVYHDKEKDYHVAGYPIPPPPEEYVPGFVPEFIVLVAVPTDEVYGPVDVVMDQVEGEINELLTLALVVGFVGLFLLGFIIVLISSALTAPLQYMNVVAKDIFNKNFGKDHDESVTIDDKDFHNVNSVPKKTASTSNDSVEEHNGDSVNNDSSAPTTNIPEYQAAKWMPRTEIDDVVKKFKKMVSHFSGLTMAKSMKWTVREIKNEFALVKEFEQLYASRRQRDEATDKNKKFKYSIQLLMPPPNRSKRLQNGRCSRDEDSLFESRRSSINTITIDAKKGRGSTALFFWIVILMVTPFLLTTIAVSSVVMYRASVDLIQLIGDVKEQFVDIEKSALEIYVGHRARLAAWMMGRPVRDLHVLTRYAGWLFSGGVTRADSFSRVWSNWEEHQRNDTCDCVWDHEEGQCYGMSTMKYRYFQTPFFSTESQDADPLTGDRKYSSFPEVDYSPETVLWWENATILPGNDEGSAAFGYNTPYSRLRTTSALPIYQPLYNQDLHLPEKSHLAAFIGFEADGTITGYRCDNPDLSLSHFVARSEKIAASRPNICQIGKHGYDSRCRGWYDTGKDLYSLNNTLLYVTPPYVFSAGTFVGQSCTAPLTDTVTGAYIGQTLIDIVITPLFTSLSENQTKLHEGGTPILITPPAGADIGINDTVIGPGHNLTSRPKPIADVVFASDPNCNNSNVGEEEEQCESRRSFQSITDKMKVGEKGTGEFTRTQADGFSEDNFYVAYAPVILKNFRGVDNSDFSRGVKEEDYFIYSLALAETEEGLLAVFDGFEKETIKTVTICLIVLATFIGVASISVIYTSYRVALSITEPMLYLLQLIGHINRLDSFDEAPELDKNRPGQSLEVVNVSKTMEALYNVVGSANAAFFTGDMEQAYAVLTDLLKMYRRLENKKGISIASNNLGNMMLTIYRTMEVTGSDNMLGLTKKQVVYKGIAFFQEAISLGEKAYDAFYEAQGWSPACLEFMQHLSNRYFNRAMFLLTVKNAHETPDEIEELGLRDLEIARDMDVEIEAEGSQAGWGIRTIDQLFEVKLTRLRGHLLLQEMGYPDDYDINECLEDVYKTIKIELKKGDESPLLLKMSPAGLMQQVERELMRYKVLKGDIDTAAKIAIRMFVEDEFLLLESSITAASVLAKYVDSPEFHENESSRELVKQQLQQYQNLLKYHEETAFMVKKIRSSMDTGAAAKENNSFHTAQACRYVSSSMKQSQRGDFTMEVF